MYPVQKFVVENTGLIDCGGDRTHEPDTSRHKRFQVAAVMTTSVRNHGVVLLPEIYTNHYVLIRNSLLQAPSLHFIKRFNPTQDSIYLLPHLRSGDASESIVTFNATLISGSYDEPREPLTRGSQLNNIIRLKRYTSLCE